MGVIAWHTMVETQVGLSWARFYILIIFSFFTMEQCANWNTFGPIAASAKIVFCWSNGTVATLTSIGLYGFLLCVGPSTYPLYRSLRWSVILGCFMTMVGALLRCIPLVYPSIPLQHYTILCYLSACCISTAGPIAMSAPLQLTACWFPPRERNTATSVGQLLNALGVGLSFIFGLSLVSEPAELSGTDCEADTKTITFADLQPIETRNEIMNLNYIHAGLDIALFLLLVIYFPSKPTLPPSISSSEERLDFLSGFKILARSRDAWLVLVTYAFPQCLIQLWQSMMVINLTELDLHFPTGNTSYVTDEMDPCDGTLCEHWVEILGVVISFVSVFASIGLASFLTMFNKRMKLAIILLLSMSAVLFVVCTLVLEQVITFNSLGEMKLALYLLLLPAVTFALSSSPIAFELSVETSYPVSEGVIGGWLTGWFNALGAVFFLIFLIHGIGTRWLNYVLPVSVIAPLPFIFLVSESYSRMKTDQKQGDAGNENKAVL